VARVVSKRKKVLNFFSRLACKLFHMAKLGVDDGLMDDELDE